MGRGMPPRTRQALPTRLSRGDTPGGPRRVRAAGFRRRRPAETRRLPAPVRRGSMRSLRVPLLAADRARAPVVQPPPGAQECAAAAGPIAAVKPVSGQSQPLGAHALVADEAAVVEAQDPVAIVANQPL